MRNIKKSIIAMVVLATMGLTSIGASASNYNIMDHLDKWNNKWVNNNNSWVYVTDSKPTVGFKTINFLGENKLFYFDINGKESIGWAQVGAEWIYCSGERTPLSIGWQMINSKWYYFNTNGYMVHDTTIDGYIIGSDGVWIK